MDDRHGADVEGVAGRRLERADAAFAQHDVEVAALRDVLRCHQPLFDGRLHAALEHDRLARLADCLQQPEVLHVASADLQHVGVGADEVDVVRVDDLGDDGQPGRFAHVGEDAQACLTETLEGVGRRARLVGTAAQQRRAGGLGHLRRLERLHRCLHRARARRSG